jgi:type II secretory pathway component PulM
VAELAALDRERGLTLFFEYWRRQGSFERALRSGYGMTESDFERHWRQRVRRQYGALALAADLSVLSLFLVLLLGPLWWRRRQRHAQRLQRMREVDAAHEARERESALAALLGEGVPDPADDDRIKGS